MGMGKRQEEKGYFGSRALEALRLSIGVGRPPEDPQVRGPKASAGPPHSWGDGKGKIRSLEVASSPWQSEPWAPGLQPQCHISTMDLVPPNSWRPIRKCLSLCTLEAG